MKVTGPNAGPPGTGSDTAATGVGEADAGAKPDAARAAEGSGQAFAEKLAGIAPEAAAPAAGAASGAQRAAAIPTAQIAADLQAGRLQPAAAIEKLLDEVVSRQLGPDVPAAVRDQLRATLRETLESDPLLAEKLRSLGVPE
jgi:hypothetical protein